jgi:hypothetical protein
MLSFHACNHENKWEQQSGARKLFYAAAAAAVKTEGLAVLSTSPMNVDFKPLSVMDNRARQESPFFQYSPCRLQCCRQIFAVLAPTWASFTHVHSRGT